MSNQTTPDNSITSFASESFDFTSLWSNTIHSSDSTLPTFGSPNFTSTPLPRPPALPAFKGHDLAEASGVTKRRPTRVTQPNDTGYRVRILPGSASSLTIPSRPFVLATQLPSAAVKHAAVKRASRMTEDHILSGGPSPLMPPSRPFVPPSRPSVPTSPAVKKLTARSTSSDAKESRKRHNEKKKQLVGDGTGNAVQMKTMLHSHENGVSVTNHIYLMTSDPGSVRSTRDVGYDRICGEIDDVLVGLSLHHSTMSEIWRCIQQVEGYRTNSWKAILVKLDIPEEHHHNVLQIMASASYDRKLDLVVSLRSILAAQQRARREALADDIDTAKESYEAEAADIAQKHGRSVKWTRNQLFLRSRMLQKTRGVNSWNAFIKAELKAENEG
ncbi:hypothetical protein BDR04DRAFT_1164841 [Suillus decipiens]|nr:hypothetical protein BDR04DRAFT_1164841 [Suillus decipiens]